MAQLELLISPEQIKAKIASFASKIDQDFQSQELVMIMVMKGAICLAADLIRELKLPVSLEFVQAESYGSLGTVRGKLKLNGLERIAIAGKNVLIVDDIFDSGYTLSEITRQLQQKNPKNIKSLVLLEKKLRRDLNFRPDYILFDIEDLFVVGYGLDYKEHYRGLPGVYHLKE